MLQDEKVSIQVPEFQCRGLGVQPRTEIFSKNLHPPLEISRKKIT